MNAARSIRLYLIRVKGIFDKERHLTQSRQGAGVSLVERPQRKPLFCGERSHV
jgi:hypothetical protein